MDSLYKIRELIFEINNRGGTKPTAIRIDLEDVAFVRIAADVAEYYAQRQMDWPGVNPKNGVIEIEVVDVRVTIHRSKT